MEELKAILFRKTAKESTMFREKLNSPRSMAAYHGFKALFSVIEDADLEDEYYDWKRKNGYMA